MKIKKKKKNRLIPERKWFKESASMCATGPYSHHPQRAHIQRSLGATVLASPPVSPRRLYLSSGVSRIAADVGTRTRLGSGLSVCPTLLDGQWAQVPRSTVPSVPSRAEAALTTPRTRRRSGPAGRRCTLVQRGLDIGEVSAASDRRKARRTTRPTRSPDRLLARTPHTGRPAGPRSRLARPRRRARRRFSPARSSRPRAEEIDLSDRERQGEEILMDSAGARGKDASTRIKKQKRRK